MCVLPVWTVLSNCDKMRVRSEPEPQPAGHQCGRNHPEFALTALRSDDQSPTHTQTFSEDIGVNNTVTHYYYDFLFIFFFFYAETMHVTCMYVCVCVFVYRSVCVP